MRATLALSLTVALALAACGGSDATAPGTPKPIPAVPGTIGIAVTTPNPGDGAILFNVSGAIQSVQPLNGYQLLSYSPDPGQTKVLVVGSIGSGAIFSLSVADKSKPVIVSVEQAAAGGTYAQRALTGYMITYGR